MEGQLFAVDNSTKEDVRFDSRLPEGDSSEFKISLLNSQHLNVSDDGLRYLTVFDHETRLPDRSPCRYDLVQVALRRHILDEVVLHRKV